MLSRTFRRLQEPPRCALAGPGFASIAEATRHKQHQTERHMLMTKAMLGSKGPNPLIEFFKDDRVVVELEVDVNEVRSVFHNGYVKSPSCLIPCF